MRAAEADGGKPGLIIRNVFQVVQCPVCDIYIRIVLGGQRRRAAVVDVARLIPAPHILPVLLQQSASFQMVVIAGAHNGVCPRTRQLVHDLISVAPGLPSKVPEVRREFVQMDLPEDGGFIARVANILHPCSGIGCQPCRIIVHRPQFLRIKAGGKRRPGRHTKRRIGITVGKVNRPTGQPVQVWRLDGWIQMAERIVYKLVCHEEKKIITHGRISHKYRCSLFSPSCLNSP